MFSVDYPYETMQEAAQWFDASLLCHNDRVKIGKANAARVFGFDQNLRPRQMASKPKAKSTKR